MNPRMILSQLFAIQGIAVDPQDTETAVNQIARLIPGGYGNGTTTFDCFINYRVKSDAELAEKLYLYLQTRGIKAFLDKKCLKRGEDWKQGFLMGLRNSKYFIALISRDGLEPVRLRSQDHTYDNVLLEYETALKVRDTTHNPNYIIPLHVGQYVNGLLRKFQDFNGGLYANSISSCMPISCPNCGSELSLYFNEMDGYTCDWDHHKGYNMFTAQDPFFGCRQNFGTNLVCCVKCYNAIER